MTSRVTAESEVDTNLPLYCSRGEGRQNNRKLDWAQDRKKSTLFPKCQHQQSIHAYSHLNPHQTPTVAKYTECSHKQQLWDPGGEGEAAERWRTETGRIAILGSILVLSLHDVAGERKVPTAKLPVTHHLKSSYVFNTHLWFASLQVHFHNC